MMWGSRSGVILWLLPEWQWHTSSIDIKYSDFLSVDSDRCLILRKGVAICHFLDFPFFPFFPCDGVPSVCSVSNHWITVIYTHLFVSLHFTLLFMFFFTIPITLMNCVLVYFLLKRIDLAFMKLVQAVRCVHPKRCHWFYHCRVANAKTKQKSKTKMYAHVWGCAHIHMCVLNL